MQLWGIRGSWTPSSRRSTCPNKKIAVTHTYSHSQKILRQFCPSSSTRMDKHPGQATRQASQPAEQASQASQNRLQIWPLQVSEPPPASRDTVAVGADPGSEISITLGTDCTATTVLHGLARDLAFPHPRLQCATSRAQHGRTCAVCAMVQARRRLRPPPHTGPHACKQAKHARATPRAHRAGQPMPITAGQTSNKGEPAGHGHAATHRLLSVAGDGAS